MNKLLRFRKADAPEPTGEPLRYQACGLDDVYLLNGFKTETIDGEEYVTIEDLDGLWKAIGLHLITMRKALAPKEVKFLRQHMDMTQAELGAQLRVTDQTVARWEKGQVEVPGPADMMLRVLFLGSKIAQPEGSTLLAGIRKLADDIRERDEPRPQSVTFVHKKKTWKESVREVEYA